MRLGRHRLEHRLGQPRLADAGLAGQQHELALAAAGLAPALDQQRQLLVAADERRRRPPACRAANRLSSARSPTTAKAGAGSARSP